MCATAPIGIALGVALGVAVALYLDIAPGLVATGFIVSAALVGLVLALVALPRRED